MWPALYIIGGLVVVAALFAFWSVRRLRQTIHQAMSELVKVTVEDIPALADECVRLFDARFGKQLSLDDLEGTAWLLDEHFRDGRIKRAFARPGFKWYFVKPMGAFVGELLRRHYEGEWRKQDGRPPFLRRTNTQEIKVTTDPFMKVFKYGVRQREKGDLYAYLKVDEGIGPSSSVPSV
jgi:hypothetical protein